MNFPIRLNQQTLHILVFRDPLLLLQAACCCKPQKNSKKCATINIPKSIKCHAQKQCVWRRFGPDFYDPNRAKMTPLGSQGGPWAKGPPDASKQTLSFKF